MKQKPISKAVVVIAMSAFFSVRVAASEERGSLTVDEFYRTTPRHWLLVSHTPEGMAIQKQCDAGVESLLIDKQDGRIYLWHVMGQESDRFEMTQVEKSDTRFILDTVYDYEPKEHQFQLEFVNPEHSLGQWTMRNGTRLFVVGKEDGEELVTELVMPVLTPEETCEGIFY